MQPLRGEFYTPLNLLPAGKPGDLIRHELQPLVYEPSGELGSWVATGTRIMYRSTDARGKPNVVTGTYFEPDNPWPGERSAAAAGLRAGHPGTGRSVCAVAVLLSIHFSSGLDITLGYEEMFVATAGLADSRWWSPTTTAWAPRACTPTSTGWPRARRCWTPRGRPNSCRAPHWKPDGPVALWGYSQGGGALGLRAGAGAVVRPGTRPGRRLRRGAPPADLTTLLPFIDGLI